MDWLDEAEEKMMNVMHGRSESKNGEIRIMLLMGIGQQLKRIADSLSGEDES